MKKTKEKTTLLVVPLERRVGDTLHLHLRFEYFDAVAQGRKLKEYRESARNTDNAAAEGEDVAQIVIKAAQDASVHLQAAIEKTMTHIIAITDEACSAVRDAALAAEKRIQESLEKALARLKDTLKAHL